MSIHAITRIHITRILDEKPGISITDVFRLSEMSYPGVLRVIHELASEGKVRIVKKGRTCYCWVIKDGQKLGIPDKKKSSSRKDKRLDKGRTKRILRYKGRNRKKA